MQPQIPLVNAAGAGCPFRTTRSQLAYSLDSRREGSSVQTGKCMMPLFCFGIGILLLLGCWCRRSAVTMNVLNQFFGLIHVPFGYTLIVYHLWVSNMYGGPMQIQTTTTKQLPKVVCSAMAGFGPDVPNVFLNTENKIGALSICPLPSPQADGPANGLIAPSSACRRRTVWGCRWGWEGWEGFVRRWARVWGARGGEGGASMLLEWNDRDSCWWLKSPWCVPRIYFSPLYTI